MFLEEMFKTIMESDDSIEKMDREAAKDASDMEDPQVAASMDDLSSLEADSGAEETDLGGDTTDGSLEGDDMFEDNPSNGISESTFFSLFSEDENEDTNVPQKEEEDPAAKVEDGYSSFFSLFSEGKDDKDDSDDDKKDEDDKKKDKECDDEECDKKECDDEECDKDEKKDDSDDDKDDKKDKDDSDDEEKDEDEEPDDDELAANESVNNNHYIFEGFLMDLANNDGFVYNEEALLDLASKNLISEEMLQERNIIKLKLDKQTRTAIMSNRSIFVLARENNDPNYKKLVKVYKLRKILLDKLRRKWGAKAKLRARKLVAQGAMSMKKNMNNGNIKKSVDIGKAPQNNRQPLSTNMKHTGEKRKPTIKRK